MEQSPWFAGWSISLQLYLRSYFPSSPNRPFMPALTLVLTVGNQPLGYHYFLT
ncbi:hypothetical protein DPMN_170661 [Dreissena polymorpha]|uniref:Uncharacterized protein n=1 Tax=Dreissena polymorpha TaxID=45954 RepID=A0A9D4DZT5_DREPO|nr:hypothetical protein DPMN_170661 [Dreissena polymorpha]